MPKIISANRLADGRVVYVGRDGDWSEIFAKAKVFANEAAADPALSKTRDDVNAGLIVDPNLVEVVEEASGMRAATLREAIRAAGPTIDFLARKPIFDNALVTRLETGNGPETVAVKRREDFRSPARIRTPAIISS
ncbi:MAG TPA: DUF2849 domain-containing protein [Methylocella sp.]|nr:DUF2849 domain-containing protein [Methylocella sp.]